MTRALRIYSRNAGLIALAGIAIGAYITLSTPNLHALGITKAGLWLGLATLAALLAWGSELWWLARLLKRDPLEVQSHVTAAWLIAAAILAGYLPIYAFAPDYSAITPAVRPYVLAIAGFALLVIHLLLLSPQAITWQSAVERRAYLLLAALLISYILGSITAASYRWRIFTLGNVDSAIVVQSLRYTLDEGRPLFNTLEKASHLAVHNSPVYFLLLPLYALCRSPRALLVSLPALCIGLSAIPLFALARPRIGALPALLLVAAYLLCPYIMARTIGDLYEMTLLPCLWLPAFYYYDKQRYGLFLLFALLSLAVKESIAATLLIFSFYSLIKRRPSIWILTPVTLSVLSLFLSFALVMPHFGAGMISSRTEALLGPFGASPQEVLRYIFHQPLDAARRIFTPPKIALIYQLFQPLLFLPPLLSSEVIFAVPALVFNLMAQAGSIGVRAWESAIFGPLLFTSALFGVQSLSRRLLNPQLHQDTRRGCLLLTASILFTTLSCAPYWFRLDDYRPRPYLAAQETVVTLIPAEASLSAPDYMMARFAERPYLQLQTGRPFWAEYHIVDTHWIASVRGHRMSEAAAKEYEALITAADEGQIYGGLRLIWTQNGIYLFQRIER